MAQHGMRAGPSHSQYAHSDFRQAMLGGQGELDAAAGGDEGGMPPQPELDELVGEMLRATEEPPQVVEKIMGLSDAIKWQLVLGHQHNQKQAAAASAIGVSAKAKAWAKAKCRV